MQLSPLQLRGYFLKALSFQLHSELDVFPQGPVSFDEINLNVEANTTAEPGDLLSWRSELILNSVHQKTLSLPYSFNLVLVGFFRVNETYPSERVEILAKTNSPAVLYSAAREILSTITKRSPFPPTLLPSINFLEPPGNMKGDQSPSAPTTRRRKKKRSKKAMT